MRKAIVLIFSLLLSLLTLIVFMSEPLLAGRDSPHNTTWTGVSARKVACSACHTPIGGVGPSGTKYENATLCTTCHVSGSGAAKGKPFAGSDQADWTTLAGTSHRWDGTMPGSSDANNSFGLRAAADLQNEYLYDGYTKFGAVVCSTCHDVHIQSRTGTETTPDRDRNPWNPFSMLYYSTIAGANKTGDSGWTTPNGTTTQIMHTGRTPLWTTNQWANFYVRITEGDNKGSIRQISSNDRSSLTVSSAFSTIVAGNVRYEIVPRHFQRITNDKNEICEDCHYYRVTTDVRTYTGNYLSHPVQKIFTSIAGRDVSDATQFNTTPLEPVHVFSGGTVAGQTGTRYRDNGGTDTNFSNNIILDSDGKVRCLSCHRIHYGDSDSTTVDLP